MSGPEPMQPDDQLLEEFLAGQGAVRERYRAVASERAPASLDAAILETARMAVAATPRRARRSRWQAPMATAAVLMLSLGVFLQVQRDPVAKREVLAPAEQAVAPTAAPESNEASQADIVADAPPAAPTLELETSAAPPPSLPTLKAPASTPSKAKRPAAESAKPASPPPPPAPLPVPASEAADAALPAAAAAPAEAPRESSSKRKSMAVQEPALKQEATTAKSQRQESASFAAPAAPMAQAMPRSKSARSPVMAEGMARRDALSGMSDDGAADAIERWAELCDARGLRVDAATRWRGLVVQSFAEEIAAQHYRATLRFAAGTAPEALTAALGSLAAPAEFPHPRCSPIARTLRQEAGRWALVCECTSNGGD